MGYGFRKQTIAYTKSNRIARASIWCAFGSLASAVAPQKAHRDATCYNEPLRSTAILA